MTSQAASLVVMVRSGGIALRALFAAFVTASLICLTKWDRSGSLPSVVIGMYGVMMLTVMSYFPLGRSTMWCRPQPHRLKPSFPR